MSDLSSENYGSQMSEVKTNPVLGILGAIIGALIGGALWIILYQIGIIASIAGVAIAYCACQGYRMLSKSEKLGGVITAVIISLIVLLAAIFLSWGIDIYKEVGAEYGMTLMDAVLAVPEVAFIKENIMYFVKELLIGLILVCVGTAPFFRQAIRNSNQ